MVNQTAAEAQAILHQDGFQVQANSIPAPPDQGVEPGEDYLYRQPLLARPGSRGP